MKNLMVFLAGTALLLAACTPQELSNQALKDRLDQHDKDIAALQGDVNELKTAVSQINSNIAALQTAVTKLEANVYVKEVTSIKDGEGIVIGYTIKFTDNTSIAIYHGEKGEQGKQGEIGPQGPQGGTPVIGAQLYEGDYYWTVNGEFLKDEKGGLIPLTGEKGDKGKDGNDGKTPQVRINEGNWEVSYDGQTWTVVGPAQTAAESVDVVFKGVKETKDQVVFTLADDSKLAIDKYVDFSLKIDDSQVYEVVEGKSTLVPYTLSGVGKGTSRVDAVASGDWWADVVASDNEAGAVEVKAGKSEKAKVIVYAVDGKGRSDMRSLIFEGGSLAATAPVEEAPAAGGEMIVPVVTNVDYSVEIEEDAQYWISYAITKAGEVRNEKLVLTVEKNTLPKDREGTVELKDANGAVIQSFVVKQANGVYTEPVFEDEKFAAWVLSKYDTNKDSHLSAEEASVVSSIKLQYDDNWNYQNYSSLAGIEAFYNLKSFTLYEMSGAKLKSLDLSDNKMLVDVTVSKSGTAALETVTLNGLHALKNVQLGGASAVTTLNIQSTPALQSLNVWNTGLTALDVSGSPALTQLSAYGTKITSLDLSKNTKLDNVNVGISTLETLTLPEKPGITVLNLNNAAITTFDLTGLTELTEFSATKTKMETLDLSGCAKLQKLTVGSVASEGSENLKTVDLRKATKLSDVHLYSNVLEKVILPKGIVTTSWSWTTWIYNKYEEMQYVQYEYIDVEEEEPVNSDYAANIEEPFVKKKVLAAYDANEDGMIDADEAKAVTELDLSECGLEDGDLAGLEVFPIKKLLLNGNKFTKFDILAWPDLEWINLNDNKLTALSVGTKTADLAHTMHLEAANNQITEFTVPSYAKANIKYLDVHGNHISKFPYNYIYGWSDLEYVDLSSNNLTSLTFSSTLNVKVINVSNNKLTTASYTSMSKLEKVDVSHNNLTSYAFGSTQYALKEVNLGYNKITSIDITSIAKKPTSFALEKVDVTGNEGFNLVIVGGGNQMPEGLEIVGVQDYGVLNASMPTGELVTNKYNSISKIEGGEEVDMTINFSKEIKAYKVAAGQTLTITAASAKKGIKFFAIGAGCTPKVTVSRGDEGKVYAKTDVSSRSENPATLRKNETTGDLKKVVVDGNDDQLKYYLGPVTYTSSGGIAAGDTVILTVSGESGETAIIFGINLDTYRDDEV